MGVRIPLSPENRQFVSPQLVQEPRVDAKTLANLAQLLQMLGATALARQIELRGYSTETLCEMYLRDRVLSNFSPKTLEIDRKVLGYYQNYLADRQPTAETAKGFLFQFANLKTRSYMRYLDVIRSFHKFLGQELDIKIKAPKTLPPYHKQEEIEQLLEAAQNKRTHKRASVADKALIYLASYCGLRRGEIMNLTVGDIDLDAGILIVRSGKGKKDRVVPILPEVSKHLSLYLASKSKTDKVFAYTNPSSISDKIQSLSKKAGLNLHTHSLRHFFATALFEKGANPRAVQELLGHENLNTTMIYVGVTGRHLQDTIKLLANRGS